MKKERMELVTENNKLGLQEYDLVKTVGKGIGIVLHKRSIGELVVYSKSSVTETHPNDDDGMAKVRRYNADGTISLYSEKTGRKLKNRDIYAIQGIVGIKSYTDPVMAVKDFINQNDAIEFDPVVEDVTETVVVSTTETETKEVTDGETVAQTQEEVNIQVLSSLKEIVGKLDIVLEKLS